MKKFLLIISFFFVSSISGAQIDYGLKAGLNYNSNDNLNIFGGFSGLNENFSSEGKIGFTVGAYANFELGKFYIQPELLFSQTTSSYNQNPDFTISYIEVPALLGYNLVPKLSLYIGPSIQFLIDNEFSSSFDLDLENSASLTLNIGARFQIGKFGLDLRYLTGLSDNLAVYVDAVPADGLGYRLNTRPNQFVLSIAYQLN